MSSGRAIRLVLNPRSGTAAVSPETLCQRFESYGCQCVVTALDRSVDLAALQTSDHKDVVWVAAGGDGTVNCVAHAVAGTGRIMGVLPTGTLNHFAQDLGVPSELEAAIKLAATGEAMEVDAAEVNGQTFVNNSSLGFYPEMVTDRDRMCRHGANKWWAMAVASVRAFARFRLLQVELEVEGAAEKCATGMLFLGNNAYTVEGEGVGRRKRLNSGLLSVCLLMKKTRFGMVGAVAKAFAGIARESGELKVFHVEHLIVTSPGRNRRLRVALDGEVKRMEAPLRYRARPGALRVIRPNVVQP